MRKALSLLGLAHIANQCQMLFGKGTATIQMFQPSGTGTQVEAITRMQSLLDELEEARSPFIESFDVHASKDCVEINKRLELIGSSLQLTDQKRDDFAYAMSREEFRFKFLQAGKTTKILIPSKGYEVEAAILPATIVESAGKKLAFVDGRDGIQFCFQQVDYAGITEEFLVQPVFEVNTFGAKFSPGHVVMPIVYGGETQEIDVAWLQNSYIQPNIKFAEVKAEATYLLNESGVDYTQVSAAAMNLECAKGYEEIPPKALLLDDDFVVTASYKSMPLTVIAIEAMMAEYERA